MHSGALFRPAVILSAAVILAPGGRVAAGEPPRVALHELAATYGFPPPIPAPPAVTLRSRYTTMAFHRHSRRLIFNNVLLYLNDALKEEAGIWTLAEADASRVITPLLRAADVARRPVRTVVLDPGHGGRDPGAIGYRGIYEKEIVLDVARRVRKLRDSGLRVRLTRSRDQGLSLLDRTARAGAWRADLLVSIHANFSESGAASGLETYVLAAPGFPATAGSQPDPRICLGNASDAANTLLGYCVHRGMLTRTRANDRGVKRARFAVLRNAPCPAVLVECGFISNPTEAKKMTNTAYRDSLADGIARGILTYVSRTGE